ncbi:diacylglycerol kinase family protein [Ornithinibacillus halotolerans]|uniref:Diacylglycerol kinase n=1 Tax=Ornithinibacillus halotolerans TaxID=1274357 RepID=A0A916RS78_9BACI|nr:diacylglycerol kinase family protein [Ornithinibacillus halotolerans]GGA68628.1 diacylglycerol kinase [Ornithinibacillus halotolerans]
MADKKNSIGFLYAINGLKEVFTSEFNFRLHVLSTILVTLAGLFFKISIMEWIAVIVVIGLVVSAELLNTAVEEIINYIKPEIHPAAKKIKDIAAAAVLITSLTALLVGILIFVPKLF